MGFVYFYRYSIGVLPLSISRVQENNAEYIQKYLIVAGKVRVPPPRRDSLGICPIAETLFRRSFLDKQATSKFLKTVTEISKLGSI